MQATLKNKLLSLSICTMMGLALSACSSMEYVSKKPFYGNGSQDMVKSKDRELGTLYLAKGAARTGEGEYALNIDRKYGRYRASAPVLMTPVPTTLALSNRGSDFRAGLEWSWNIDW